MLELFLLGCTGVVVFLHGANFFFHSLSRQIAARPLSFLGFVGWQLLIRGWGIVDVDSADKYATMIWFAVIFLSNYSVL